MRQTRPEVRLESRGAVRDRLSVAAPEKLRFEPLDFAKHDVAGFWSGNGKPDVYLKRHAQREIALRIAVVMVLTHDGKTIDGYYRLQQFRVDCSQIDDDRKISADKVESANSVLLRLSPGRRADRQLTRKLLLMGALKNVRDSGFRCESVLVEAGDNETVYFYEQLGFASFHDYDNYMFVPMGMVEQTFAAAAKPEPVKDDRKKPESNKSKNEWDHGYNPQDDEDDEPIDHYANGLARFWRKRAG